MIMNNGLSPIPLYSLFQVLYEQDGVFIHPSCGKNDDQDNFISGVLRVIEKVFVQYACRSLLHLLAKLMRLRNL